METSKLIEDVLVNDQYYTEQELNELGIEYTKQNFSKYLIFKKANNYYLVDRVNHNQFRIHLNFSD